jgi:hypothetical protein
MNCLLTPLCLGTQRTSSPVTVDVGPPYPTIAVISPVPGSSVHGSITILATHTSAVLPATGRTLSVHWITTALAAGSHTLTVGVNDASAPTVASPPVHTVGSLNDNRRRYRFEIHTAPTFVQFARGHSDMAFAGA